MMNRYGWLLLGYLMMGSTAWAETTMAPSIGEATEVQPQTAQSTATDPLPSEEANDTNGIDVVFKPYQPTYIIPFYYTQMSQQTGVSDEKNKRQEIKFQLSFQTILWDNIFKTPLSMSFAYTQLSYWQAYAKSAFFRETNYEPELFLTYDLSEKEPFYLHAIRTGFAHQSNGRGGGLERSWNRVYADFIFKFSDRFSLHIKPWYRLHGFMESRDYNPDITDYLGHGRLVAQYRFNGNIFALTSRNNFESGFSKGMTQLSWSFPLYQHLHGYVQLFAGYGQSLVEYDHYTNGVGIGFSLSDWDL